MSRFQGDLPQRTFDFACRGLDLIDALPSNVKGWEVGRQLLRSSTSVGSNVHEAENAFSDNDFAYKCSIARKEATESHFWLRLRRACGLLPQDMVDSMILEADQLVRILSSVVMKTEAHLRKQ